MRKIIFCIALILGLVACSDPVSKQLPVAEDSVDGTRIKKITIDSKECLVFENGNPHSNNYMFVFDCDWHPNIEQEVDQLQSDVDNLERRLNADS